MSNYERHSQNRDNSWRQSNDRPNNDYGRRGRDVARIATEPSRPPFGLATKSARKTSAQTQSDLDSCEDSHLDSASYIHHRNPRTDDLPTKTGQTMWASSRGRGSNHPTAAARRVTFALGTQIHSSTSGVEGRLIPQNPSISSQTRPQLLSKSASQGFHRRDPFLIGMASKSAGPIRLAQPSTPRPAYGSGMSVPRFPTHPTTHPLSSPSRFSRIPAGESISSAGRRTFSKGARRIAPPSKSRPLPPLEAIEDAIWRKGFSSHKTSATPSGVKPALTMTMSAARGNARRTSVAGDQVLSEDADRTIFLGRNMTIYENGEAMTSGVTESSHGAKQRVVSRPTLTGKALKTMQTGRKAGAQGNISRASSTDSSEESSEESSESSEDEEIDSDVVEPETGSEGEAMQRSASPSNKLIAALEALVLPSLRMQETGQLPFLLRNLRRGFVDRCFMLGVPTKQTVTSESPLNARVIFRLLARDAVVADDESYSDEYQIRMGSWSCPVCSLHGDFGTQTLLQKHIEWDHPEIKSRWAHDNRDSMCSVELYVPEVTIATPPTRNEILSRPSQLHTPHISAPISPPALRTIAPPVPKSPVHSKLKTQPSPPSGSISAFTSQTLSRSRSRSVTLTSSRFQTREPPSQPPLGDLLGPSAQYPYLPESSEDGEVYFSCRPGGPRIYDLLNTLSLAPFGVLSWFIIDREEELFEVDDVLDEDKVMQALWGRWIMTNHRKFLANYCAGTVAFVDEYWEMIHRAAGWAALRAWLLMFVVNRFLTGSEVTRILRHYEGLIEMDFWQTNEE